MSGEITAETDVQQEGRTEEEELEELCISFFDSSFFRMSILFYFSLAFSIFMASMVRSARLIKQ